MTPEALALQRRATRDLVPLDPATAELRQLHSDIGQITAGPRP